MGDFVPQGTSGNAYRLCGCHRMLQVSRWWEILLDTSFSTQDIVQHGIKLSRNITRTKDENQCCRNQIQELPEPGLGLSRGKSQQGGYRFVLSARICKEVVLVYTFESLLSPP